MTEKKQFPSEKQDQYMLRFPDGMRDQLKEEAAKNNRSLNSEIIARLESSFTLKQRLHEAEKTISAQEQYVKAMEKIDQLQRATAGVLGSLVLDPLKTAQILKDNPEQLLHLIRVSRGDNINKTSSSEPKALPHKEDPGGAN